MQILSIFSAFTNILAFMPLSLISSEFGTVGKVLSKNLSIL